MVRFTIQSVPRARGFTRLGDIRRRRPTVCSPCAGVYPWPIPARRSATRLFPVRGGLPTILTLTGQGAESVPRARGFTRLLCRGETAHVVCSPCAGVHPVRRSQLWGSSRLFPVRGGSPGMRVGVKRVPRSVPRARGFTCCDVQPPGRGLVCSPCAGVHPAPTPPPPARPRFFPVRGGSPGPDGGPPPTPSSLPRTRGFTRAARHLGLCPGVSSPCAGVHPTSSTPGSVASGLFPVRGGSPARLAIPWAAVLCLPRARGFTLDGLHHGPHPHVSSPCAGVHPRPAPPLIACGRIFPVRGGPPMFWFGDVHPLESLPRPRGFMSNCGIIAEKANGESRRLPLRPARFG